MGGQDAASKEVLVRSQLVKTELCSFYMGGHCAKGKRCHFAHGLEEVQPHPDLTKTSLCLNWKRSRCRRAAGDCPYAHGEQELRKTTGPQGHHVAKADKLQKGDRSCKTGQSSVAAGRSEAMPRAASSAVAPPPLQVPQDKLEVYQSDKLVPQDLLEGSSKTKVMDELTRRLAQMAFAPIIEYKADAKQEYLVKNHDAIIKHGAGANEATQHRGEGAPPTWVLWSL